MPAKELTAIKPSQYLAAIRKETCSLSFCEQFDEKSQIWDYSEHAHDCIEIIYFLDGKAEISTSDQDMALSLFEVVVYPSKVVHQEFLDTRYRQSIICLHLECTCDLAYDRFFKLKDEDGKLRWIFKRIYETYHAEQLYNAVILQDLIHLLLDVMVKYSAKLQTDKSSLPEKCLQYLQEHYAERISMATLAEKLFVSASYLNRIFKRQYKITPIKYLNLYRTEVAREILVQTDYKIANIALLSGFEDARNFSKVFRKATGLAPGQYRKLQQKN